MRGLGFLVVAAWSVAACWPGPGDDYDDSSVAGSGGSGVSGGSGGGTGGAIPGAPIAKWQGPEWSAALPPVGETCAAPEDHSRWEAGSNLFVGEQGDCAEYEPCFGSIAEAVEVAQSNDVVMVLPGTHAGFEVHQSAARPSLRIRGIEGPDVTVLTGSCVTISGDSTEAGEIWLDGFTFQGCEPPSDTEYGSGSWGISVRGLSGVAVRIQDNRFTGPSGKGGVSLESSLLGTRFRAVVARNRFLDLRGEGDALSATVLADWHEDSCIRVENNLVARCDAGVTLGYGGGEGDLAGRVEVVNNTIAYNARGLAVRNHATVANNILFANGYDLGGDEMTIEQRRGGVVPAVFGVSLQFNLISDGRFTGLNHNFSADPLFADAAADDFDLLPGSPAANSGSDSAAPELDLEGAFRDGAADLGAFDHAGESGSPPEGIACGDGVVTNGPTPLAEGTFTGYETCDDDGQSDGDGCSTHCQTEARGSLGVLSLQGRNLCVVRGDESIECWGSAATGAPATGSFQQVAVGTEHACALGTNGNVSCWRFSSALEATAPSGSFTRIAAQGNLICGLRSDGSAACWHASGPPGERAGGPFSRIDSSCFLDLAGMPVCEGRTRLLPAGPFVQAASGSWVECFLRTSGELVCLPTLTSGTTVSVPAAAFVSFHQSNNYVCTLRPDGRAILWGPESGTTYKILDAHPFVEVQAEYNKCCGVTADRKVWCSENVDGFPAE